MDIDEEREKIGKFIKSGLLVLSIFLLAGCSIKFLPKIVAVFHGDKPAKCMPINSVSCEEKKLALSFDVSGENEQVDEILEALDHLGVKATFFITGEWIDEHEDQVKAIYNKGHEIGNRGLKLKRMSEITEEECEKDIRAVHAKIKDLTGQDMKLFRAPFGEYSESVLEATKKLGYYPIGANIDSMDWKDYGVEPMVNQVCNHEDLSPGSFILCHTDTKFTKDALNKMVKILQKKGYTFEKISEMNISFLCCYTNH